MYLVCWESQEFQERDLLSQVLIVLPITVPTLVVSGQADLVLGHAPTLAQSLGQGRYVEVPGANHFSLAAEPSVRVAVANFMRPAAA